jgi:hypothetical protein
MLFLRNANSGNLWRICQLCFEPMCWTSTDEELWWHCHECDLRDCDEEAYED